MFQVMTIGGIPVAISFTYLIILALNGIPLYERSPLGAVAFALVLTLSLLVHEFGHALVARYFRLQPRVSLWMLGGLTHHMPTREHRDEALIVIAGPAAGLAFGAIVYIVSLVFPPQSEFFVYAVQFSEYINIWWSLVNLLPAWPLDGGQLLRIGLTRYMKPAAKALRIVHVTGAVVALLGLAYSFSIGLQFTGILAGLLAWQNISQLMGEGSSGPVSTHNDHADDLLRRGMEALGRADAREAVRLGHQAKGTANLSRSQTGEMWTLLGLATTEIGEYDEALTYLQRAPQTAAVEAARARCVTALAFLRKT